jgi:hypothetical protein
LRADLRLTTLGDHDPSGLVIDRAAAEFLQDRTDLVFERIAVTPEQTDDMVPNGTANTNDKNTPKFIERFGSDEIYELDAVSPVALRQMVRDAIDQHIDRDAWEFEEFAQTEERSALAHMPEEWNV